jgi:predicted  nucleic acid-binding Zn-ribbon protein
MATREAIIKITLENQDALRQLGKWEADLIGVREETKALNKAIKEQGSATVEQERQLGALKSSAKLLSAEVRELSNETSTLTERGLRFRDKMADATLEAIKQSGVLGQLAARTDTLTKEITELNASFKAGTITEAQYTAQQEKLQSELTQTTAKMAGMDAKLDELNKDFQTGRITAEQFKTGVQSVNTEVGKASGAFTKGVTDLKQYALGFVGIVAAAQGLGALFSNVTGIIADFDAAQSRLAAILGTTKNGMSDLTDQAKELGATTAFTASQVSDAQTELAKLGFTQNEILASTPALLDLARGAGADIAQAAEIAAGTLNAFGLGAEETTRLADVMAKSFSSTALDIDKFSFAMRVVGPVAKNAGLSIEETTALIGVLADNNIRAETSGTGLRNILGKLAQTGMTYEEAMRLIGTSTDKTKTAIDLFGLEASTVAIVLADNTAKTGELTEAFGKAGGAAKQLATDMDDNLIGDKLKLTSAWEGFVLSVEDGSGVISSVMRGVTQSLTDLLESLNGANEETSSFTSRVLGLLTGSTIIQGYEDTAKWWNRLFGSDAQEEINATAQAIQGVATATNELPEFEVVGERATVGRELDKLKTKLEELKEARNNLTLSDIAGRKEVDADIKSTEASIAALEGRTTATKAQAAVVRLLTDEMRAFQAAQKAINEGQGIGMMDGIGQGDLTNNLSRFLGGAGNIGDARPDLAPGTAITENLRDNLSETATLTTDYTNLFMNMSTAIGQSLGDSFGEIEDANKRITLSILEMVRNAARMYIAMAMAREIGTKGFIGLGTGIALTVAIEAALAAAINNIKADGFAQGGVVRQSDGPRYTRNPGDSVLISAAPGEVVMTREQQRRANMAAGFDVFRAARVPGFAVGGIVQSRGTALVNMPTAPRPSPSDLSGIRNAFQQAPIFVRVSEINQVQGTVARITERASL